MRPTTTNPQEVDRQNNYASTTILHPSTPITGEGITGITVNAMTASGSNTPWKGSSRRRGKVALPSNPQDDGVEFKRREERGPQAVDPQDKTDPQPIPQTMQKGGNMPGNRAEMRQTRQRNNMTMASTSDDNKKNLQGYGRERPYPRP